MLELAGIPLAPLVEVPADPDQAAEHAARLGFPLVAKAVSTGLVHKSDVGGVILGIESAQAAAEAVGCLDERLRTTGRRLDGVILQRQVAPGIEALVAARRLSRRCPGGPRLSLIHI